ncbi:hypothetical protein phiK7A1_157 [Pseudomonas phage phiK7A1]|uniref:Uncharacterized protein n=1 Tax=Pseudomonas phage phiK7A1 TaxID=2759194 RepID=A0A7H0XG05_9CAUD|nr:hypothetical protein phiK7A1_157 [Pseudomonas phage phiK7A1]
MPTQISGSLPVCLQCSPVRGCVACYVKNRPALPACQINKSDSFLLIVRLHVAKAVPTIV